jgi:prephenate dehydrogenase
MTTEIFFIGLNSVTVSMGLALKEREVEATRVGFDPDRERAQQAFELAALDKITTNLRKASKRADIAVLASSIAEQRDFLELLGELLKPEAVVLDTSPLKTTALKWAEEFLPADRYYVGLTPIVGYEALHTDTITSPAASANLFEDGLVALIVPPTTPEPAVELAIKFATLLGASPFFVESAEHDAATALSRGIPWLLSAAIMRSASGTPGWHEAQRLIGPAFAAATGLSQQDTPEVQGSTLSQGSDFVLHKLDAVLAELHKLRDLIAEADDEGLKEYMEAATLEREEWLAFRERAEWRDRTGQEGASSRGRSFFSSFFGFGLLRGRGEADDS